VFVVEKRMRLGYRKETRGPFDSAQGGAFDSVRLRLAALRM